MKTTAVMAAALWVIGLAAIVTIFYISVTRGFLTGAVEFGALLGAGILVAVLLSAGLIDRQVLKAAVLNPKRDDLLTGAVFTTFVAVTSGLAVQFPRFPWPAGILAALLITGGFRAALAVRHEPRRH